MSKTTPFRTPRGSRAWRLLPACAAVLLAAIPLPRAENVNPANDGSKFAYAENAGWINAQPLGPGAQGMQVNDLAVTGWLWSENAGWISLTCSNDGSCASTAFGVTNDLAGRLGGFGWGENVGWVNFAPGGVPVTIDRPTGTLTGRAWGENIGWITFSAAAPVSYGVKTSWCLPAPASPSVPTLGAHRIGPDFELFWNAVGPDTYYDVVRGDVATLRAAGGNFALAAQTCVAARIPQLSVGIDASVPAGHADWFLVRSVNCGAASSYDDPGGQQVAPRDAGIAASGGACP